MADRYAYIPLIGIFVMIAWGLADLAEAKHVRPVWCVIPALCVLAALGSATVPPDRLLGERLRPVFAHAGSSRRAPLRITPSPWR